VADVKYFRRALANRNFIREEIKSRLHWKEFLLEFGAKSFVALFVVQVNKNKNFMFGRP
jgi:hypothetical protein